MNRTVLLLLAIGSSAAAQTLVPEREFFELAGGTRPLVLAHGWVDADSFRLVVAGETWQQGRDYRLRTRDGVVIPLRAWTEPAAGEVLVMAAYTYLPVRLTPHRELHALGRPPTAGGSETVPAAAGEGEGEGAYGDLTIRGSKSVHVASGNRRELTVDQNLRLTLDGQLTRDIAVRAMLTDDNLPVVPEGNTEELQDIDNVLVELTAPRWRATLGDFVGLRTGTVFGDYRRKLQGITVVARPADARVEVLAGSPRGRYRTLEIRGQEANQGPYFLGSGETASSLFVVAGSERVTLDGQVLTRGADRDYVLDYVRGTVTFTYRRLITAQSLVLVEFEEGEGPYARSVVGAGAEVDSLPGHAVIGVRLTRERDDPGRLRTGELSAGDEAVLAAAGDDPLAALASGAKQVEAGTGDYVQEDRGGVTVYVFAPEGGDWDVSFSYVGAGAGDYELSSLTESGIRVFVYRGAGLGSYAVGRLLPLPQSQELVTVTASMGDSLGAGVDAEWNLSQRDRNVRSARDDGDNAGEAGRLRLRTGEVEVAGGRFSAFGRLTDRGGFFVPMLSDRTVFAYEPWGLGDRARRAGFLLERDRVIDANAGWNVDHLSLQTSWARLDHGPALAAQRWEGRGTWHWRAGRGSSFVRRAAARDEVDPLDVRRHDQDHEVAWTVGPVVPRVTYNEQQWRDAATTAGFRYQRRGAGLAGAPERPWQWNLGYEADRADSLRAGGWRRERDSGTWRGSVGTPRLGGVRATGEATVRAVNLSGGAKETTRLGRLDLSGNWARLGSDWSLAYAVDNSRAEVLQRQIVFVGANQGNYNESGDFVGIEQGDYNLVLAGTDSLVATTAVQADLTWRQEFKRLGNWSSATRIGVQSRSRTEDVGGLLALDPDVLFDPATVVLARVQLKEELDLLRNLPAWNLRLGWEHDEARDRQYVANQEDRLRRRHQATLTWNATRLATLRLRATREADRRTTDAVESLARQSYQSLQRQLELEGSLRPVPGDRLSLALEVGDREDAVSRVAQTELALTPAVRWSPHRGWTLQSDLRLARVTSDEPAGSRRPYFFPRGGTNVDANTRVSWNPNDRLTFALVHVGRKQGDLEWQHELRLESSARF